MKKITLVALAILSLFLLGSCVKGDAADTNGYQSGDAPIVFGVQSGAESRAVPTMTDYLPAGKEFGVYAYVLNGNPSAQTVGTESNSTFSSALFDNTKATVKADKSADYDGGTKYWPSSKYDRLKILAYYPRNATGGTPNTTTTTVNDPYLKFTDYTVPTAHSDHVDFMVASDIPDAYKKDVHLKFYHALTRITFEAKKSTLLSDSDICIKNISIKGIKNIGTLTVQNASAMTSASWVPKTGTGTTGDYTGTYNVADTELNTATYTKIATATDDSFLVMPLGNRTNFGDATLEVIATCDDVEMEPFSVKLVAIDHGDAEKNAKAWEPGQWVNYRFEIKPNAIVLAGVSVNPWPETPNDVDVTFP